jgi:hypothetical protein
LSSESDLQSINIEIKKEKVIKKERTMPQKHRKPYKLTDKGKEKQKAATPHTKKATTPRQTRSKRQRSLSDFTNPQPYKVARPQKAADTSTRGEQVGATRTRATYAAVDESTDEAVNEVANKVANEAEVEDTDDMSNVEQSE